MEPNQQQNTTLQTGSVAPQPTPDRSMDTSDGTVSDTLETRSSWSWGGLMFGPAYLIATKNYVYLLLYLLMLVPFINLIAIIAIPIFLALKGHDFVAKSSMFKNNEERNGFNRAIDHAGFVTFMIILAFISLVILSMLFLGWAMFSLFSSAF